MKTEELKALGLTEEQVAAVMKENGKDILVEQKKTEAAELKRDNYKGQLDTAQSTLKEFEGIDVKEIQAKVSELETTLATKETDYQTKVKDMEFTALLNGELSKVGAKSTKAVAALLDMDALKSSKNQKEDIAKAVETLKTDNDYMFASKEPIKNPVKPTTGGKVTELSKETFQKLGYLERVELKKSNPQKYEELKGE